MFFILLIFFREIFGLDANNGLFVSNRFGMEINGMELVMDQDFGLSQPRFNASCDEDSLNSALECEAGFEISFALKQNFLP